MSYGEMLLYGGIALMVVAVLLLVVGNLVCIVKMHHLKKKLYDKYGF